MQSITTTFSDQNTVITNIIILFQSSFKGSSLDWDIESVCKPNSSTRKSSEYKDVPPASSASVSSPLKQGG